MFTVWNSLVYYAFSAFYEAEVSRNWYLKGDDILWKQTQNLKVSYGLVLGVYQGKVLPPSYSGYQNYPYYSTPRSVQLAKHSKKYAAALELSKSLSVNLEKTTS